MPKSEKQLEPGPSTKDQRRAHRWKASILCLVECDGKELAGTILDLSRGGAFIEMPDTKCPVGSKIRLEFEARNEPVTVSATVIHCGWFLGDTRNFKGFGVRFDSAGGEDLERIEKLIGESLVPAPEKWVLER